MKIKKEHIILAVIILALSLYVILRNPNRTHYKLPELSEVAEKDISKIEISKSDASIVLNKEDDKWHIAPQGYLADTEKVKNMLDSVEKFALTALVSESKNYSRYDLDDENKITVKAWTGGTLKRKFEVGKAASSFRHTFVRLADDHRVYHAMGNLRTKFDETVDKLRDKTVLSFDKTEIQDIRITKDKQVVAFNRTQVPVVVKAGEEADEQSPASVKEETLWQTADGKKADETQLDRLLSTLSNLSCEKYIDDKKKEYFKDSIYTVQLVGAEEYTLSIFAKTDKDAENYPAVSSANDYPFLLQEWQAKNLMKKPDELMAKSKES